MNSDQSNVPLLCAGGCGFYGSPTTRNLCSKCYREIIREEGAAQGGPSHLDIPAQQGESSSIPSAEAGPQPVSAPTRGAPNAAVAVSGGENHPQSAPASSNLPQPAVPPNLQSAPPSVLPPGEEFSVAVSPSPQSDQPVAVGNEDAAGQEKAVQVNKGRCWKCNKRVGLLGFQCRCGYFYCGQHRHADSHACEFDYKSFERSQLSRANQKVVADKVTKI